MHEAANIADPEVMKVAHLLGIIIHRAVLAVLGHNDAEEAEASQDMFSS